MQMLGSLIVIAIIAFIFVGGGKDSEKMNTVDKINQVDKTKLFKYETEIQQAVKHHKALTGKFPEVWRN